MPYKRKRSDTTNDQPTKKSSKNKRVSKKKAEESESESETDTKVEVKQEKKVGKEEAVVVATPRCQWGNSEICKSYHDNEWGVPLYDDTKLFEFLILEGFQAGLSWAIILKKREAFRKAFAQFDPEKVAKFGSKKIEELMENTDIVRNKLKINAAVNNAKITLQIKEEFKSLSNYFWSFVPHGKPIIRTASQECKATSAESDKLSADLKKRGMKFVGSTVMYSHLQACGMVNDHDVTCFRHPHYKGNKE